MTGGRANHSYFSCLPDESFNPGEEEDDIAEECVFVFNPSLPYLYCFLSVNFFHIPFSLLILPPSRSLAFISFTLPLSLALPHHTLSPPPRLSLSFSFSLRYDSKASASDSSAEEGDSDREKKKRPAKKAKVVKERKPRKVKEGGRREREER